MQKRILPKIARLRSLYSQFNLNLHFSSSTKTLFPTLTRGLHTDDPPYLDIPKPRRDKSERKPYPTPMKVLIHKAKAEREARKMQPCRVLEDPPDNGLLVPELVECGHQVFQARERLLSGLSKLVGVLPVRRCSFCFEVHIGHRGHEIRTCTGQRSNLRSATHVWRKGRIHDVVFFPKCFHLFDRVGKPRVVHNERCYVPRIPAVLELCIQAGVDLKNYPAKRRTKPVYCIEGRIADFESVKGSDEIEINGFLENDSVVEPTKKDEYFNVMENLNLDENDDNHCCEEKSLRELSIETMESWFEMISGAKAIMEKYKVWTCGYCPEVQVGPKGHKARNCKATKHQSRDGLHAWQEARIEDLIGPNYVWHVRDPSRPLLDNNLKRYYGKAPAVVELCVQGGAPVPDRYRSMMRLDVVPPERDEVDLVA